MNIKERIAEKAEHINKVIEAYLPAEEGMQKTIFEAIIAFKLVASVFVLC